METPMNQWTPFQDGRYTSEAMIRGGFERALSDVEERDFQRQDALQVGPETWDTKMLRSVRAITRKFGHGVVSPLGLARIKMAEMWMD